MATKRPERYIIYNTTVKKPRYNAAGRDTRRISEKKGYVVQFRDERDSIRTVSPAQWGANPVIVTDISQGLLDLHSQGLIRIEKIEDIVSTLSLHKQDPIKSIRSSKSDVEVEDEDQKVVSADESDIFSEEKTEKPRSGNVVEMGVQDYSAEDVVGDHGYPGAVNPDGKDNFTVVASSKKKKKKFSEFNPDVIG